VAATSFCLLVFWWVWGGASWKILTDVLCAKASLELSYFQVGSHMIVAVGDPLLNAAYWACHDLFRVDVFYEHLELRVALCLFKNLINCGL